MAKQAFPFRMGDITERGFTLVRVSVPPEAISVLTQVRRTISVGEDLLPSILEHGQQTAGVVAALCEEEARLYVKEINEIYSTNHVFDSLAPVDLDGERVYLILVAGHRRHATVCMINEMQRRGEISCTGTYRGLYRAELRFGLNAKEAIALQFNENRHCSVPSHEEARAAWDYYRWLKRENPALGIAAFGQMIGRHADWVRNAVRFCLLPHSIQNYVDGHNGKTKMPYRILVELARLAEGYESITGEALTEDDHHRWIKRALTERLDATKFGRLVSEYLQAKREDVAGQLSLFGSAATYEETRSLRQVVARNLVPDLWKIIEYMRLLIRLQKIGGFGTETCIGPMADHGRYSPGSPVRLLAQIIELIQEIAPLLAEVAARERRGHVSRLRNGEKAVRDALEETCTLIDLENRHATGPPS